jgi:hypothetical protein
MPDSNPTENLPPKHDPFDAPDAEDEADTRERVLEVGDRLSALGGATNS